jgi:hypothetical protein
MRPGPGLPRAFVGPLGPEPALVWKVKEATMTTKRHKARTSKANLGQKEAKQQELSEEQFSHMKGGKSAKSLEQQKRKEQSKK